MIWMLGVVERGGREWWMGVIEKEEGGLAGRYWKRSGVRERGDGKWICPLDEILEIDDIREWLNGDCTASINISISRNRFA